MMIRNPVAILSLLAELYDTSAQAVARVAELEAENLDLRERLAVTDAGGDESPSRVHS